ncbi:MAG: hypothetical protein R3D60_12955 [Paracoccaceae bacterium]
MTTRRRPWGHIALVALAGGLSALGQAPWGLWPVTMGALAVVLWCAAKAQSVRAGFAILWLAGTAHFIVALNWLVEPFLVEAAVTGWMAPFALIGLAGGLALFWGMAGAFALWARQGRVARLWIAALALLAAEAARGTVLTGFPWALAGHALIGTPLDQLAALGAAGPSALVWDGRRAGDGVLSRQVTAGRRWHHQGRCHGPCVGLGRRGWRNPCPRTAPDRGAAGAANAAASRRATRPDRRGSSSPPRSVQVTDAGGTCRLVLIFETAAPFSGQARPGAEMTADAAGMRRWLYSAGEIGPDGYMQYFNSLAVIGSSGAPVATLATSTTLCPSGNTFLFWARRPGIYMVAIRFSADMGYVAGPGLPGPGSGRGRARGGAGAPLICYEAVFAPCPRGPRPD